MGRQYQRFILELYLKCFEEGLKRGRNSITSIVNDLILSAEVKSKETFFDLLKRETAEVGINESAVDGMSLKWHQVVNQSNPAFEGVFLYDENIDPGKQAVVGLARWYLRARALVSKAQDGVLLKIASAGSVERVSLKYMVNWLDDRLDQPLAKLLYDLISNFVFAQHLRVALSRFDGRLQRIRFLLDDEGIVLTSAMKEREAGIDPYMMADRSFALASLLTDLGIFHYDYENELFTHGNIGLDGFQSNR